MVLDKIKILSLIIKEGTPLVITAYKNNVAETNLQKSIEANKKYFDEAQKVSDKSVKITKKGDKMVIEDVKEEECTECNRTKNRAYETEPSFTTLPPDVKGEKDPHYDYTVRELSKHLSLLQNHYTDYRCPNCIGKHLMIIEGLGEEGVPMVKDKEEKKRFQEVIKWAKEADGRTDYDDLIDEARDVRISLTGMEHGDTKEDDEEEHNHDHEEE